VNGLRSLGWLAGRAPASLGDFDVWAARRGLGLHLIEVKSTAASAFSDFGPQDRADLLAAADLGGATPWLWWNPPGRRPSLWFPRWSWPGQRKARGLPGLSCGLDLGAALAAASASVAAVHGDVIPNNVHDQPRAER
jgi:hypothetical protein